jgi:membrane-associated phospholipid phosphatase
MPTLEEAGETLLEADAKVVEAAQPYQDNELLERLADLGDQPAMRVICVATVAAGMLARDPRFVRAGVRMLVSHTLATWTKDFIKHRVDRTRPRSAGDPRTDHRLAPGRSEAKEETSFPSGHAAGASAVARAFAREVPDFAAPAYGIGTILSLAQIPRCAHYPTDVGAGVVIGLASDMLVEAGMRWWPDRFALPERRSDAHIEPC